MTLLFQVADLAHGTVRTWDNWFDIPKFDQNTFTHAITNYDLTHRGKVVVHDHLVYSVIHTNSDKRLRHDFGHSRPAWADVFS